MADVTPGDGRKVLFGGHGYDAIWAAAVRVANEHFDIREQNEARGVIRAERRLSGEPPRGSGSVSAAAWPPPAQPASTASVYQRLTSPVMGPGRPSPMGRPSTRVTGVTPPSVPVTKASAAA